MHEMITKLRNITIGLNHNWLVAIFLLTVGHFVNAQPALTVGYNYLHNKKLDLIYQTYNTSRQWQSDPLVPLTYGLSGSFGWNVLLQKRVQLHVMPSVSYSRFSTAAENNSLKYVSTLHLAGFQTEFRFNPRALIKGVYNSGPLGPRFFMTLTPGYQVNLPILRKDNLRVEESEGEPYGKISGSFNVSLGSGWNAFVIGRFVMTPKISATWIQTMKLDDFSENLIGSNVFGLRDEFDNVFIFQAALQATFLKSRSNWWDKPNASDKQ